MKAMKSIGAVLLAGGGLATMLGLTSAEWSMDPDAPHLVVLPSTLERAAPGVALASFGLAELSPDDGPAVTALHLRATVANTSPDRAWSFDASRAVLEPSGGSRAHAMFVNSDVVTLPIAILDPGERIVIDLYFPLSRELVARGGPERFAVSWPMSTPEPVATYAWFDRGIAGVESARELAPPAGWGSQWWFDPSYPWATYFRRPGHAVPRPPRNAVVSRAPEWNEVSAADRDEILRECNEW